MRIFAFAALLHAAARGGREKGAQETAAALEKESELQPKTST
jgi:hypothetical protein